MGIFDLKPSKKKKRDETAAETAATPPPGGDKPLEERIVDALKEVYDPEIPVNIYDMGLIYKIDVAPEKKDVKVDMTLTSPHCPAAQILPGDVQRAVESVGEVGAVQVEVVWEPPWDPEMMSETAKLELGMF